MLDFHRTIVETGRGTAPITYFRSAAAITFCLLIAAVGTGLFAYAISNPMSALASVFSFAGGSKYALSVVVPLASIALIRSKFIEVDGTKVGLEYGYDTLKSWAVKRYKELASEQKRDFIKKLAKKIVDSNYPVDDLLHDVDQLVSEAINHKSVDQIEAYGTEITQIRANIPSIASIHTIEHALGILVDNTSIRTAKKWAKNNFN